MSTANMEVAPQPKQRRPVWVWVIAIFYFLSAGWTLLSYSMILRGSIPLTAAQRQYFNSLSILDYAVTIGIASLNLIGAVLLFLLRRRAFLFLMTAFVLGLLVTLQQILMKHWLSAINAPGLVGVVIGWVLTISILTYTRRLTARGVLA